MTASPSPLRPRASVVIPAFNAEADLPRCLDALRAQEGAPPFEVVVVDDGSRDDTARVARERGAKVISSGVNRGPGEARNRGAREAGGDILLFTDADCVPAPDWVREMVAAFDEEGVDGALGAYRTRQRSLVARHLQAEFTYNYRKLARHGSIDHVPTHAAAYRAPVFREAGGFRPRFRAPSQEDIDLSYRLAATGKRLVFRPGALVEHRHPATIGGYFRQKHLRAKWKVLLYREHPGKLAGDAYTSDVLKAQLVLFLGSVAALGAAGIAALLGRPAAAPLVAALVAALALLASALPQAIHAARTDSLLLGLASPLFSLLRAAAFGLGLATGTVELLRGARAGEIAVDSPRDPH